MKKHTAEDRGLGKSFSDFPRKKVFNASHEEEDLLETNVESNERRLLSF